MAITAVTLRTLEREGLRTPTGDVRVRVYSADGLTFITEGDTEPDGTVTLLLEDVTSYWVRFFRSGWRFPTKALIFVDEAAGWTSFDAVGTDLIATPTSTDPALCRASGQVVTSAGVPLAGVGLQFHPTNFPILSDGRIVAQEPAIARSGPLGRVEVELIRGGIYEATLAGMGGRELGDFSVEILIPDTDAVQVADLLWPYVAAVDVSDAPVALAVGTAVELGLEVRLSSGLVTPYAFRDEVRASPLYVRVVVEDPAVLGYSLATTDGVETLRLIGLAAGTTTVTFEVVPGAEASRMPALVREFPVIDVTVAAP